MTFKTKICKNYQLGFCKYGPKCQFEHVKPLISIQDSSLAKIANFPNTAQFNWYQPYRFNEHGTLPPICDSCGEIGHKATFCNKEKINQNDLFDRLRAGVPSHNQFQNSHVTCFKCKEQGHYANMCPLAVKNKEDDDEGLLGKRALTLGEKIG